jgi:16S rRNA (cytosine967-C5)-methyltransferase
MALRLREDVPVELPAVHERLARVPWSACAELELAPPIAETLDGHPAERVVDRLLRAHPSLSADGRQAAAEAVFGVSLWRRRAAARLGADASAADPRALLFAFLVDLARLAVADALALSRLPAAPHLSDRPLSFAEAFSLPDWLAEEIHRSLPTESEDEALAGALCLPAPVFLRVNSLLATREQVAARLRGEGVEVHPCLFSRAGLVAYERFNVLGSAAHQAGLFEVQDEGSQLLGLLVEAKPGDHVLDACAGAGGKSLLLASELRGRGVVHAYDTDLERMARTARRAERAGATTIQAHWTAPPASLLVQRALVDAPCSELGALRRGPDLRWRIDPGQFASLPVEQVGLCEEALGHVEPGGRLVYATCTFRREENEDVARELERRHPELERQLPGEGWLESSLVEGGYFHSWPHRHGTDGFFAAVYRVGGLR